MKAIWNGTVLAESDDTVVVDGNHYFPRATLKEDFFQPCDQTSVCGWKGTASYLDVVVGEARNDGAAWFYPAPKEAAKNITGRVAFWKGVTVEP